MPSSITAINSNTAPGSFSFSNPNPTIFPLKTDRKSTDETDFKAPTTPYGTMLSKKQINLGGLYVDADALPPDGPSGGNFYLDERLPV